MKILIIFLITLFTQQTFSQAIVHCGPNQMRIWTQSAGYACVSSYPSNGYQDCVICRMQYLNMSGAHEPYYFNGFPSAIYQPNPMPWWAYQGNMYYPNMNYPGAWTNNGMNNMHYDGKGNAYLGKPNVYVESIHKEKKFTFSFTSNENLSFICTTPLLEVGNQWSGKIIEGDRFEVDYINYDYLFYDIRLPQEKLQYSHGLCVSKEDTIKWMMEDLKALSYPAIALQDFEQHWSVKLPPDYPYFCIYPQYNKQMDEILPVKISLEQSEFVRSHYLLIPHAEQPSVHRPNVIPLPTQDPETIRPKVVIKRENSFKEWGVAFLGADK